MNPAKSTGAANGLPHNTAGVPQEMRRVTVTPALAEEWLASGRNFRRLDKARAAHLSRSIQAVGWIQDGNPFKFNSSGELVDGQHRLKAISLAGVTVTAWAISGVDDDRTIDEMGKRTVRQHLEKRGEKHAISLAASLNQLFAHRKGRGARSRGASNAELLQLLDAEPDIRDALVVARAASEKSGVATGQLTMLVHVATRAGLGPQVRMFAERLATGIGLSEGDPILLLRARMARNMAATKMKLPPDEKLALLIVAWNKWLRGRTAKYLGWRGIGPKAEPFPTVALSVNAADEDDPEVTDEVSP